MYKTNTSHYGINPERIFDCPCLDNRKSFYGKAKIIETKEGRYLQSYDTIVCFLSYGGTFIKLWDGYSLTTMRHINSFMRHCRLPYGGKQWWDSLETEKRYDIQNMEVK